MSLSSLGDLEVDTAVLIVRALVLSHDPAFEPKKLGGYLLEFKRSQHPEPVQVSHALQAPPPSRALGQRGG